MHRKLNNIEESVLMKGLKFIPTPQRNNAFELKEGANFVPIAVPFIYRL